MTRALFALLCGVVACGDNLAQPVDAPVADVDASTVPAQITISGTVTERTASGSSPAEGVVVAAYRVSSPDAVVASTTSDATGEYMLVIDTNGEPLDGFVKGSKAGYIDTFVFPPAPLVEDLTGGLVNMVTQGTFDTLSTLAQANQLPENGMIALIVWDKNENPLVGATVSSTPAASSYKYNGSSGLPSPTASATQTDGVAYMFNLAPGDVMVSADRTGIAFQTHTVMVRADAFTTTIVRP